MRENEVERKRERKRVMGWIGVERQCRGQ